MPKSNYKPILEKWHLKNEVSELKVRIFEVLRRTLSRPVDNKEGDFFIIKAPTWVNVIALTRDGQIVLVEQYRHGIHDISLEIPGGVVDPGEDAFETARRELAEETGYESKKWSKVGRVSSNPAILNNYTETWLAEDCERTRELSPDEFEELRVVTMPVDELLELVRSGEVHHALIVAALGLWQLQEKGK